MPGQKQSAHMKYTLLELLYRNKEEELERDYPQVLALLSHHHVGFEAGIQSIRELSGFRIRLWGWAEDDVRAAYDHDKLIQLTGIDSWLDARKNPQLVTNRFSHLFIPVLSFSLVSDIVRLNDRRPFVNVILQALLRGHRVTALKIGADPYHPLWHQVGIHHGTPSIKRELYEQLRQLQSFGVQLVDESDLSAVMARTARPKRGVLTKENIQYAYEKGEREIRTARGTIVTPLAADMAKQYEIRITTVE